MASISKRTFAIAGIAAVLGMSLSACDLFADTKQSSADPTSKDIKMTTVKGVVGMPQGFRNVALGCDEFGDMIFVTSRGDDMSGGPQGGGLSSGLFVVPGHKACAK